jgi:hypothetical protein
MKRSWHQGENCPCGAPALFVFQCGPDGHLPIPKDSPLLYACTCCHCMHDGHSGLHVGRRRGLAQRFEGAIVVEIIHSIGVSYAWYGDSSTVFGWQDDGSLVHTIELLFWSLDQTELKQKVRAYLKSLDPDPGCFQRIHDRILKQFNREKHCGDIRGRVLGHGHRGDHPGLGCYDGRANRGRG